MSISDSRFEDIRSDRLALCSLPSVHPFGLERMIVETGRWVCKKASSFLQIEEFSSSEAAFTFKGEFSQTRAEKAYASVG
jgi:hypothetical protein